MAKKERGWEGYVEEDQLFDAASKEFRQYQTTRPHLTNNNYKRVGCRKLDEMDEMDDYPMSVMY